MVRQPDRRIVDSSFPWGLLPSIPWAAWLCWYDCRERRLPNLLTLTAAGAALLIRLLIGGMPAFLDGFAAAMVAGAFLFIPFLLRGAGGGDVKMLFACGAMVGWSRLLPMLLYTSFAGLAVGVGMLLVGRLDGSRVRHYVRCAWDWRYDRRAGRAALPPKESERVRVPFSLAITIGLLAAIWFA